MSDPTTPTGKRLAALPAPGPGVRWPDAIIAIEQEAAAANEADADRLAETLLAAVIVLEMMQTGYRLDARDAAALVGRADDGREALRQHDAAKEAERVLDSPEMPGTGYDAQTRPIMRVD